MFFVIDALYISANNLLTFACNFKSLIDELLFRYIESMTTFSKRPPDGKDLPVYKACIIGMFFNIIVCS